MSSQGERAPGAGLGLLDATMTGAGIFVLTGLAAEIAGPTVLLVALNAVSTAASGSVETVFTTTKVSILLVFVAFGAAAPAFSTAKFQPLFTGGDGAFILSAVHAF